MALNDRKIIVYANPVANLPDHPSQGGWTAAALKAAFDANATGEIKASINGIVEDLKSVTDGTSGADEIGATPLKVGGAETVQGQLKEMYDEVSPIIPTETARVAAENTRVSNENTRISNENTRIASENTRVSSENTRVTAENQRIANENLRQSTVAAIEANYAPRLTTAEQQINDLTDYFTATIITTWTGSTAPFSQTVSVIGIKTDDNPIIDIIPSGTYATDIQMENDWANIYRAVTSVDAITFYSHNATVANIPIQVKVVR